MATETAAAPTPIRRCERRGGLQAGQPHPSHTEAHAADQRTADARAAVLWEAWLSARARALQSCDIRDGIAAGRAFGAFLHAFAEPQK